MGIYLLILCACFGGGVIGYFVAEALGHWLKRRGHLRALAQWQEAWRRPRR